jgi:acetylornithine deacetylase
VSESLEARLEETLRTLVAFDTTSRLPNQPLVDWLEPRLVSLGFRCERQLYPDDAGVEKVNLVAVSAGRQGTPELALVGHTDCVPYDSGWAEALQLTRRDDRLYGRGACDTKAFIACALLAAERTQAASLRLPVALVFTADEEVGCLGAKMLLDARRGGARNAIVGEPTSLTPIRANKGYCLAEVDVSGKEGHSAYPDTGASAIFRAARLLARIEAYARGPLRGETDVTFEPPYTTLNVGLIQGGRAKNVIPGHCTFTLEWRPIPGQSVDAVPQAVEQLMFQLRREEPGCEVRLRILRTDRGVDTAPTAEVVRFLEKETGKTAGTVPFGTEAPQMTALGAKSVVFGPGNIQVAHQTGEYVPIAELVRCEEILERALRHFCE